MKLILLSKGYLALVDDEDYERLSKLKWCTSKSGYAVRTDKKYGKQITLYMHKAIIEDSDGWDVDHINGNKLDNRKCNLRKVSRRDNLRNLHKKKKNSTSKYFGVSFHYGKWIARIKIDRDTARIGSFDTEVEAAKAYNIEAQKYGFLTTNILIKGA